MKNAAVCEVLKQRGSLYGDYGDGLKFRSACLQLMASVQNPEHPELRAEYAIIFADIIGKVSRLLIVQGHHDSWTDLAGYSRLNQKRCGTVRHVTSGWVSKDEAFFIDAFIMIAMESFVLVNGPKAQPGDEHKTHLKRLGRRLYFVSRYPDSFLGWKDLADYAEKVVGNL